MVQETAAGSFVTVVDASLTDLRNLGMREECGEFTRNDFQEALNKVSKKQNLPIGENIRDTIKAIKGK